MKHSRSDYEGIQGNSRTANIGTNEPVFLLRAQDTLAPGIVDEWATRAENIGAKSDITISAHQQAVDMRKWQVENTKKIPDMP